MKTGPFSRHRSLFGLFVLTGSLVVLTTVSAQSAKLAKDQWQYESGEIRIPAASSEEPRTAFGPDSIKAAVRYLDDGALAWTRERKCIACHSTGVYLAERTQITHRFGPPSEEVRTVFATTIPNTVPEPKMRDGRLMYPEVIQAIWRTLGLAQWDRHVSGRLSDETVKSIRDMLMRQSEDGLWTTATQVEIPYIRTDFELGVEALRAIAAAPGWLEKNEDKELAKRVEKLKEALAKAQPANDFERVQRLQVAGIMPELVTDQQRQTAQELITTNQKPDGGWSTRSFSKTKAWGPKITEANIAMIDSEPDAADPASDPFMTAFVIVLLRESGTPADDPRIKKGIAWLKANQRASGRWWMKSLYRDTKHYITYIATAQVLRALDLCNEL